jgi:hypothetical protein
MMDLTGMGRENILVGKCGEMRGNAGKRWEVLGNGVTEWWSGGNSYLNLA